MDLVHTKDFTLTTQANADVDVKIDKLSKPNNPVQTCLLCCLWYRTATRSVTCIAVIA